MGTLKRRLKTLPEKGVVNPVRWLARSIWAIAFLHTWTAVSPTIDASATVMELGCALLLGLGTHAMMGIPQAATRREKTSPEDFQLSPEDQKIDNGQTAMVARLKKRNFEATVISNWKKNVGGLSIVIVIATAPGTVLRNIRRTYAKITRKPSSHLTAEVAQ